MNISHKHIAFKHQGILLLVLYLVLLPAIAYSKDKKLNDNGQKNYDYVMKVNRSTLAVVDSNVVVSLQITAIQDVPAMQSVVLIPELEDTVTQRSVVLPMIFLNSHNQQIYFERYLTEEYPDAVALHKKRGENLEIDYLRTVKYEPWMQNAVLKLLKQSCACNKQKNRGELMLAAFNKKKPEIKLYPIYLLPPADNSQKVREEKGSAYLCFEVNKWDIKPNYMTNPVELQKIFNSVNLVKSDSDVTIRKMTFEGYASPEGTNDHNLMLSEKRTEALKNYLAMTHFTKGIRIESSGKGENWEGFIKYLRNNPYTPQRDRLLNIALSNRTPDEKERTMRRETPEGFLYVLRNAFPALRCTNYTVVYTVRPFTIEESERVYETRPANLSLNEIYRLADKYAGNQEKYYSIIRKASLIYPNDSYINLTMAFLAIKRMAADEASEYLSKVKACPEKTLNEGIVAYMKGDMGKAEKLVQEAARQGLPQAAQQLKEFEKIK
jgi:outer membrane protein OmpA-like peptidoglycan-associated protein